ncbi:rho family-interacting cell polarization regulator 1-like [Rhopilema esculentum]|uniref:rho family-interacting cell polarization regulator 1-like n=1 Tax=Rhopilema esculentum TaxID=499914 RepID=UPI0031D1A637
MESDDEILGLSPIRRYNTLDTQKQPKMEDFSSYRNTLTLSDLPQRSRSMMNLSSAHHYKRNSWLLPESPTVSEKQSQLTKRKSLSGALLSPPPKTPSVERYLEIFSRLKSAYSAFLDACKDVDLSNFSIKEKLYFEKCTKKLDTKLQKVEDLNELYVHQEHMREGANKLLKTMEKENSKRIKNGIDYCRSNLKKNVNRLCAVQDEVNDMAGSMRIEIVGLIGFARLSSGDVYSVHFKHGYDKFTSKCKVVGQGQKWTNAQVALKINAAHDIIIKVHEVRKINTNSVGVVTCPISNFLSADGQEFVLPVNSTGSLKLKIMAFWSPFVNKESSFMAGKISMPDESRLDTLSDTSGTQSPCSTPKSGTLSSMPSLSTNNGTLTSMRISVSGTYLSPQARVIKHSKADGGKMNINGSVTSNDSSSWVASVRANSLPDIAKTFENTGDAIDNSDSQSTVNVDNKSVKHSIKHASSCDYLSENVVLRDTAPKEKRKPRPITLGPTFTNGFSSQSDYENVVNLITTSIIGEKPDVIPDKDSLRSKKSQRPKSVAPSFMPTPLPDYPTNFSPRSSTVSQPMHIILEPDYSPPYENSDSAKINELEKEGSDPKKQGAAHAYENVTLNNNTETEDLAAVSMERNLPEVYTDNHSNTASPDSDNENMEPDQSIENDDTVPEVRAMLLDITVRLSSIPEAYSIRAENLKEVVNVLLELLQEKKKPISRTESIENALNSIDSAFDFLSEHQTLKPDRPLVVTESRIYPGSWRILKKALVCHLRCCQNLLQQLEVMNSPLKIKQQKCLGKLLVQAKSIDEIFKNLTNEPPISPASASLAIDISGQASKLWQSHFFKAAFECNAEQLTVTLSEILKKQITKTESSVFMQRIQDMDSDQDEVEMITVFQFANFLSRHQNLAGYYESVRKEERLLKILTQDDDLLVMSALQDRKAIPIVPSCLKLISQKLSTRNKTMQRVIVDFLTKLAIKSKEEAIDVYLEMLDDEDEETRLSACYALKYLEAAKAQDFIAFLWKNDTDVVRKAAFDALKVVGFPPGMELSVTEKKLQYSEVSTRL